MIELIDLKKTYIASGIETHALRGIDLTINPKEFVSILGKSGCGKSTLLNILGGMDYPTSGQYLFEGIEVNSLKGKDLANFRNQTIGYIFQSFHLINEFNIVDNVALPLGYAGVNKKTRKNKSIELLEIVGLKDHLHKFPSQLSGGQQQRVAIARALVNNPRLLLADEPTGNLDEKNSQEIIDLIKELHKGGTTIVLITHDKDIAQSSERIISIVDGIISSDEKLKSNLKV